MLSDGFSGGIIILWHKNVGLVTPIAVSKHALHIIISSVSNKNLVLSLVYNSLLFRKQCFLWQELSKLTSLNIPWLILGDFNSILHRSEHKRGSFTYYDSKARFFPDFIEGNNLMDLNFSGSSFTWCNNQSGLAHHWARLDRCLVNFDWINTFKTNNLRHLNRSFSDHSFLFLSSSTLSHHHKRVFRFDNSWFNFLGCHSAVYQAWGALPTRTLCMFFRTYYPDFALIFATGVVLVLGIWKVPSLIWKQKLVI